MANADNARGLWPIRHQSGAEPLASEYGIKSGYAANIFRGDVVEGVADGTIEVAEGGNVDNLGVFWGCRYVNAQGEPVISRYWPTGTVATNIVATVYTDPGIIFGAQADTAAADTVHLMTDWNDGAGSAVTGLSGRELVVSAGGTTVQALRILGKINSPDNDWGAHVDLEVQFAEHVLMGVVSGVGGI
jgi:hypothetical protein